MHKFFVDQTQILENEIKIVGEDCNHIYRVLRLKKGEKILVNDRQGTDYYCIIQESDESKIICQIEDLNRNFTELPVSVTLFQGLPKHEKMEWIIQKGVELGVSDIYPVTMKRSISKLNQQSAEKKVKRWNKIAESAAKQSNRGKVPKIHFPISVKEVIDLSKEYETFFIPHEEAKGLAQTREALANVSLDSKVAYIIGPEGGFSKEETDFLTKLPNSKLITLGKRILRTETAGLAFLSMLSIMIEEDI